jgi:hypothetical protein
MENAPFGVQLEFAEFERLTDDTSKLNIHVIYRSVADERPGAETGHVSKRQHGAQPIAGDREQIEIRIL